MSKDVISPTDSVEQQLLSRESTGSNFHKKGLGYKLSCCDFYEDEWEMKELMRKYPVAAAGPKEDLNRQLKRDMVA